MKIELYHSLLSDIKDKIKRSQLRAVLSVNAEMIALYWDIGQLILQRQKAQGWSAAVIPKLAIDLKNELPDIKGFSERNLGYMLRFAKEYPDSAILQQLVAKLPWGHNL